MPTTIKEIAQQLGLHPSTVSRALSGSPQVSAATRERVLQTAGELRYAPNQLAQSLVRAANNMIGCLILEFTNPFFVPMVRAIKGLAAAHDYTIMLGESQRSGVEEKCFIEQFRRMRVAGVIVMPVLADLAHLQALEDEGTPVVVVGRSTQALDSVNVDNERGGYLVGRHLLALGHRRVGIVISGEKHNQPEQARLAGLWMALKEAGLGLDADDIYNVGGMGLDCGRQAAQRWLAAGERPTAVFGCNDLLAMGLIDELQRAGVGVPEDLAVVGYDDIPFADLFAVPLTTVAFPKRAMGRLAIERLLVRLADGTGPHEPQHVVLEPRLVVRRSSGWRAAGAPEEGSGPWQA